MGFLKKFFTPLTPTLEVVPSSVTNAKTRPNKFCDKSNPEAEQQILAIESQALALGWTWKQLWFNSKRPDLRGLASDIQKDQIITQVTRQYIQLERISPTGKLEVQRFYNHAVDQPWLQECSP